VKVLSTMALAAVTLALGIGAWSPAPAHAGSQVYLSGMIPLGGGWGARHTINNNYTWNSSTMTNGDICANAADANGWVGQTQCNSRIVNINYCACALRYPWAGPAYIQRLMHAVSSW
jgi:hypothetical protein